jgi:hypothetical protein
MAVVDAATPKLRPKRSYLNGVEMTRVGRRADPTSAFFMAGYRDG